MNHRDKSRGRNGSFLVSRRCIILLVDWIMRVCAPRGEIVRSLPESLPKLRARARYSWTIISVEPGDSISFSPLRVFANFLNADFLSGSINAGRFIQAV